MKLYYSDDLVTLYHGDCREVLPMLDGDFFTFTDPPYNVNKDYSGWNDNLPTEEYLTFCGEWIGEVRRLSSEFCIYPPKKYLLDYWSMLGGGNAQQIIITWTPEGAFRGGFVDQYASLLTNAKPKCRTKNVWTNMQVQGLGYFFKEDTFGHPGYTSENITAKVLNTLANPDIPVLDPFGGTGTTARVCVNLGRKCVTVEYSERWCEFIATRRLAQMVLIAA